MDWDDAYANSAHIPGAAAIMESWPRRAAAFRAVCTRMQTDLPYGAAARERFDMFHPAPPSRGLVVFVHGGYWMACEKSDWSHLAQGALDRGWAVAMPSYSLAPAARIGAMVGQIGRAISTAAGMVDGPVRLVGHSAGGHLVARMACADAPLTMADRVDRVVSISGLHDLHPLMHTSMNRTLGIDATEAQDESPAGLPPQDHIRMTAWVGAHERPEFLRQARLLEQAWPNATAVIEQGRHHFDVIDGLCDGGSALMDCIVGQAA